MEYAAALDTVPPDGFYMEYKQAWAELERARRTLPPDEEGEMALQSLNSIFDKGSLLADAATIQRWLGEQAAIKTEVMKTRLGLQEVCILDKQDAVNENLKTARAAYAIYGNLWHAEALEEDQQRA